MFVQFKCNFSVEHTPVNRNDDDDFGRLYDEYRPRFIEFARGYVKDRLAAEDLVTDSFLYFWENRGRIDPSCNVAAYVFTTLRHKCLNYLRARLVRLRAHNEMEALENRVLRENIRSLEMCDPRQLFEGEIERLVRESLDEMSELTRGVFTEQRFRGRSYREVAELFGITERRVATELEKALTALRRGLHDYLPAVLAAALLERLSRP
ncbi:RNA polymerase subunit sigma-70 [Alistipes sp. An54]|nr:RNA polymerase subunit sigma-70 [Alistipes sp. An54]